MKVALGVLIALVLLASAPAFANAAIDSHTRQDALLAQASPSPATTERPTASPSPGAQQDRGGISTGAGIVIAAILIGGLLLMRSKLLRR